MQIGFLVRKLEALGPSLSTVHLIAAACNAGHDVLVCEASGWSQLDSGALMLPGIWLRSKRPDLTSRQVAGALLARAGEAKRVYDLSSCEIVFPRIIWSPEEMHGGPLLNLLGRMADQGVLLINGPDALRRFATAHQWSEAPAEVQPPHLITRDLAEAQEWLAGQAGDPAAANRAGSELYARTLHQRSGVRPTRLHPDDAQRDTVLAGLLASDSLVLFGLPAGAPEKRILWMDGKILGGYAVRAPAWTGAVEGRPVAPYISDMNEREAAVYLQIEPVLRERGVKLAMIAIVDGVLSGVEAMTPGGIDCIDRLYNCRIETNIVRLAVRQANNQRSTKPAEPAPEAAPTEA
ncbi:MAG: hypothetical protein ACREJ2_15490 [Planctomycetota bacterium]